MNSILQRRWMALQCLEGDIYTHQRAEITSQRDKSHSSAHSN